VQFASLVAMLTRHLRRQLGLGGHRDQVKQESLRVGNENQRVHATSQRQDSREQATAGGEP